MWMVDEDARHKPLDTQAGFDPMVNAKVQSCRMTFGLMLGRNPASASRLK